MSNESRQREFGGDSLNQLIDLERTEQAEEDRKNHASPLDHPSHDVAKAAMQRIQSFQHSEMRRIECDFHKGLLVLHGRVSSYYLKQLAQESVRSIEGIARILNRLEVDS